MKDQKSFWLIVYAFGVVLLPPVMIFGKSIYAAELLLLPPLILSFERFLKNKAKPNKALIFLIFTLIISFFAGMYREEMAKILDVYAVTESDGFNFKQDFIRMIRWGLIFSTPWMIHNLLSTPNDKSKQTTLKAVVYSDFFISALMVFIQISAGLSLLEKFNFIDLSQWGYYEKGLGWLGRSHGTFGSPLDASLVYAFGLLVTLFKFKESPRSIKYAFGCLLLISALALTGGFTAGVSLALTLWATLLLDKKNRKHLLGATVTLLILAVIILILKHDSPFITQKFNNFIMRTNIWSKWVSLVLEHPWIFIAGIGFSNLVVDNSYFLLLIKGGILHLIGFIIWLKPQLMKLSKTQISYIIFWLISWLALDSIGYWGIGRIMWILIGLYTFENTQKLRGS